MQNKLVRVGKLMIESASGKAGEIVAVPINIDKNPYILSFGDDLATEILWQLESKLKF